MSSGKRCPDFASILQTTQANSSIQEQVATCFHEELRRLATRRCQDLTLGQDAAQDALVIALESLDTFRGDAPIDHWLSRLVTSACSRLRRGRKNDPSTHHTFDEMAAAPDAHSEQSDQEAVVYLRERISLLQDVLDELSEVNRELLLLHEGQEVPLTELARRFDMTVDGVKSRLKRTRAQLRDRLIERANS